MIRCSDKILIFFAFIISLGVVFNNGVSAIGIGYSATFSSDTAENLDGKKEKSVCVKCSSDEISENKNFLCGEAETKNLTNDNYCTLTEDATECLTYKYTDEKNQTIVKRDCGDPKNLTCKILYDEKFDFLHLCNSCKNNLTEGIQSCNEKNLTDTGTKCYKCNSDEEPCTKDEITEDDGVETCDLDDTVHQKCIAYKYIDDKDGKYKTYRGCVPDDTNSNIEQFPNTTINFECSEKDRICNNKFDNLEDEVKVCIQCDSSKKEDSTCGDDEVSNLNVNNFCILQENETCVTYRYRNDEGNLITKRGCAAAAKCASLLEDKDHPLDLCYTCDKEACNRQMSINGKCYQCHGNETECSAQEIVDSDEKCILDPTVHKSCTGYKYIGSDGKVKTRRECSSESSFDSIKDLSNTITKTGLWCNADLCNNGAINTKDEKKVCIQCDSSKKEDSTCADDEVSNLNNDNFCSLADDQKCITYRYKDAEGKQVTKRGCEAPDKCASLLGDTNQPLDLCNTCEEEACNRQMSTEGKCFECDSDDQKKCSAEEINDTKMKQCYLDQTVHTLCVAYKYFDDNGKIKTHRGCSDKTNLDAISKSTTTITTKNLDCKTDQCNKNAIDTDDEKNICIKCSSEDDGTKCTETELSGLSDDNFVVFKDTESECVVYKYTEGTGDAKKEIIQRNVVPKTESCNVLYEEKFDSLELCTSCNTIGCNSKKPEVNGKQCYKCSSEIISACENLETLEKCPLGDSIHQTCVQYKYIDGKDGKYKTYRGCAPAGTVEEIKNYPNTTIAYDCEDNLCNGKFSDIPDKTMYSVCVQCNSDKDENCRESEVSNFNQENFCRLEGEANECLTYKYTILNADNKTMMDIVERGCLKDSLSCSSLYNEKFDDLHLCDSCNNDLVNDNEGCNKKALTGTGTDCYKCNTDDDDKKKCNDEIKDEDDLEKCVLDTTVHKKCITYKYLDNSNGDIKIYRGCAPEKREDLKNETIITVDCEDALCNANFNKSDEKIFCIKCSSADNSTTCNKDEAKNVEYCRLEEDETCIGYSYGSANDLIERNCVKIESGCEAMIESNKLSGPLKTCIECTNGQFCNLKLNKTIINGAISTTPVISLSLLSLCFSLYYLLFN